MIGLQFFDWLFLGISLVVDLFSGGNQSTINWSDWMATRLYWLPHSSVKQNTSLFEIKPTKAESQIQFVCKNLTIFHSGKNLYQIAIKSLQKRINHWKHLLKLCQGFEYFSHVFFLLSQFCILFGNLNEKHKKTHHYWWKLIATLFWACFVLKYWRESLNCRLG